MENQHRNKYDSINLVALIKAIQATYVRTEILTRKGQKKYKLTVKQIVELREMKDAARRGLRELDRNKTDYFFIGAHVKYKPYRPNYSEDDWDAPIEKEFDAVVEGYDGEYSYIHLEGNVEPLKVHPSVLTLKYLRETL